MKKENILGFNVCDTTYENITENLFKDFNNSTINFIVNINPEIIINYYKNKKIKTIFNEQKYQIPDGIGIVWASKKNKGNIKKRITGVDLMQKICAESINYNSKIFLYGGKEEISKKAKYELEKKYPGLNIVDICNGYTDKISVIEKINNSGANILFVGLGSPKQEEFIINNRDKLPNIKIFMPVGRKF